MVASARWKLTKTDRGHIIQAQTGRFKDWYLDSDGGSGVGNISGADSSRSLLLTKDKVPSVYWKLTDTPRGHLFQPRAGKFAGWYLDLDLYREPLRGKSSSNNLILTQQLVPGAYWRINSDPTKGAETWDPSESVNSLTGDDDQDLAKEIPIVVSVQCAVVGYRRYRDWFLDFEGDSRPEKIDGKNASRNLLLTKELVSSAQWKLTKTDAGYTLQARSGTFKDWYLDSDGGSRVSNIDGGISSRGLMLAKERVPTVYWDLTKTRRGYLLQPRRGKFAGWHLDLDLYRETLRGKDSSRNLVLTKQLVPGAYWKIVPMKQKR